MEGEAMNWLAHIDPSIWLLVIVGVSWGALAVWIGLLMGLVMKERGRNYPNVDQ